MLELSPEAFNAAIAGIGLLLYIFVWRVTRDLPSLAKAMARVAFALVAIIPAVLAVFFATPTGQRSSAPPVAEQKPQEDQASGGSSSEAQRRRYSTQRKVEVPPPPTPLPLPESAPSPAPAQPSASPPPPPPAQPSAIPPPAPQTAAAPRAATRSVPTVGAPAPPAVPAPSEDYDIVPVFYGTDRDSKPTDKRMNYDFDRAKRLELGRAMVTVPKAHEVPNIERPWVYRIPLTNIIVYQETEDPKKHFTMQEVKALSRDDFLALVRARLAASSRFKDHALVFVHGFNTTFDFAVYRAAQMTYDLKFDGAPFVYSWPSKGQIGLQDYGYDRGSAEQAEPYLKEFLQMVAKESGAKTISIIAHSMGNLLLLPVLRDLKNAAPEGVQISQIILAAPDVDRDRFENLANEIKGYARGTTLYVASNDWALELSKRLAGSVARAGDSPPGGPLLIPGIDTIDVTATSTDLFALHHSGYAEKTALINDIQLILQTGQRPPELRLPLLEKVTIPRGIYWRYPAGK